MQNENSISKWQCTVLFLSDSFCFFVSVLACRMLSLYILKQKQPIKAKRRLRYMFLILNSLIPVFYETPCTNYWSGQSACDQRSTLIGPSEVRATSGANLGRPLF